MILDKLVLENVGTFRGRQAIELTPPSPQQPVVLVGGLNGAGKTTILESIHLALYGPLSQMPGRRSGSYENYLRSLTHRESPDSEAAAVDLTFHIYQQGQKHTYRVRRRWRNTGTAVRETLDVWLDDKPDEALTATWNEHVENYLPRGISGLFFFDGEQIEALADLDRSQQVLSSALSALLGLDVIDRLATDLTVLRRRHRGAEVPRELRLAVEDRRKVATATRQAEEAAAAAVASARVESERADKRLYEVTERYRAAGGELLERRDAAESRVTLVRQQINDLDEELRREAAENAPLLQVANLLEALAKQIALEQDADRNRTIVDVFAERDREILNRLRTGDVQEQMIDAIQDFLAADVTRRQASSQVPRISGLRDNTMLEALRVSMLPQTRTRLVDLLEKRRALSEQLDQADRTLVAIPDPEALGALQGEMEEVSQQALRCQTALNQAEDHLGSLRNERARADSAYEAALDKSAQASLSVEDDHRTIQHIDRIHQTLQDLKTKATAQHVERISNLILNALTQLLRKDGLVKEVLIDPLSQTVQLTDPAGRLISASELSAGERQLLAVALLWGLAQAAGQPLPMVIDTPLGRLDGTHREHLITRYFPHASHQVVLLSTDTEIDQAALDTLRPQIGRMYRLDFDTATNATTVNAGYFWE